MPYQHTQQRRETCAASYRKRHPFTPPANLPGEQWVPVIGYESTYEVSDCGRVRRTGISSGASMGRILRQWIIHTGYVQVTLSVANKQRSFRLSRLVTRAFHGEPPTVSHEANHKNGDKLNNRADNLEWVTSSQNKLHALAHGLMKLPNVKLTETDVRAIRALRGTLTYQEIGKQFGIGASNVCMVLNRQTWNDVE